MRRGQWRLALRLSPVDPDRTQRANTPRCLVLSAQTQACLGIIDALLSSRGRRSCGVV